MTIGKSVMKSIVFLFILFVCTVLRAEVTLDGTLGARVALEGPNYQIGVELGQQQGSNLFHSFDKFNLTQQESATFSGPVHIKNVLSRVTGGRSFIDGQIRSTIPNADVYFINPAGLVFGQHATLDVQGSFHASTADTLLLQDGGEFNALNPAQSLLTVAPVSAFGFLSDSPSPLSMGGSQLKVPEKNTLSLIGGNIQIQGRIDAINGRINIASTAANGTVTPLPKDLTLSNQAGDVTVQNALLNSLGKGDIFIRAGKFVLDRATVGANTAGTIPGGSIHVQADNLMVTRGGRFTSNTRGLGQGGKIKIEVAESTTFSGENLQKVGEQTIPFPSGIYAQTSAPGEGGSIELETNILNLKEGAMINATTVGQGNGGYINIRANNAIMLSGVSNSVKQGSAIAANTTAKVPNAGQGGTIILDAQQLSLTDGARISTTTQGNGQGGNIHIKVSDNVTLSGENQRQSRAPSMVSLVSTGTGDAGMLRLEAGQLNLTEGTNIGANTAGLGKGGDIKIQAASVNLSGENSLGIGSSIGANAFNNGDGGTIELIAEQLRLTDGAQIATGTQGKGQGGNININVAKEVFLSGFNQKNSPSTVTTISIGRGVGNAGNIVLVAGDLVLNNHAQINAETKTAGLGGNVTIQAQNINLTEGSMITARSDSLSNAGKVELNIGNQLVMQDSIVKTSAVRADGGNISIITPNYIYLRNSQITATVNEDFGGGGNISLEPEFVILDGSQIFAKAKKGRGGNINITTTGIYNFTDEPINHIINASSEFGVDGEVKIESPDIDVSSKLFVLSNKYVNAEDQLKSPCNARLAENLSSFVMTASKGASPHSPGDLLASGPRLSKLTAVSTLSFQKTENIFTDYSPTIASLTECRPNLSKAAHTSMR